MAYYFVSDVHAAPQPGDWASGSGARFLAWLDAAAADAEGIFLLGDIFDFWFEYKRSVPPGFGPLLDKFRELTARGVEIHFFPGNHDLWTEDFLSRRCGLILHAGGWLTTLYGRNVYLEHGDRQSADRPGERMIQRLFRSPLARRLTRALVPHPWLMRFGNQWSHRHRARYTPPHAIDLENGGILRFAREYLKTHAVDLFVFGHLHTPAALPLSRSTTLYLLGDWLGDSPPVYGRLDEGGFSLISDKL